MLYERDGFTQNLGEQVINFVTWQCTTGRLTCEILHTDDMPAFPYQISIEDDVLEETVLEDVSYKTLDEAKAFIDGYLAAAGE